MFTTNYYYKFFKIIIVNGRLMFSFCNMLIDVFISFFFSDKKGSGLENIVNSQLIHKALNYFIFSLHQKNTSDKCMLLL